MGTHRKSHEGTLKKALAAGAIAGAAVGFGALAASPMAFADTSDNEGWWLGSGNASNNNTIFGQMGSGNANQFGNFNGNIMNNQLNAFSPVIGGTAAQVNTPAYVNTQTTATTLAPTGNGAAVGTTVGAPAVALPIGAGLGLGGSNAGANTGAAIPIAAGAAVPIQAPIQVPALNTGAPNNGFNSQTGVGAQQTGDTVGAIIDDSNDEAGDAIGNLQVADADSGNTSSTVTGGNTRTTGTTTGGTIVNNNTPSNTATAAGNIASNTSSNNTQNNSGNDSDNSVGNDNED